MSRLDRWSYLLIITFPIFIISIKVLGPLIYVLLSIIGAYYALSKRVSPLRVDEVKLFSWLALIYFIIMVLSVMLSTEPTNEWRHLSRKAQFLIAPLVGLTLYYANIPFRDILKGIKIGVLVIGSIVISQYILGNDSPRLSGMFNPNSFADMAICLTMFSIVGVKNESRREYLFTVVVLLFGVAAVVMSNSRASILSFAVMLTIFGLLANSRRSWLIVLLAILSFFLLSSSMGTVSSRFSTVKSQIEQWEKSEDMVNSVGVRLEMYRAGVKAFLDSPLIGYGYRNANPVASRYASESAKNDITDRYTHLHNEYITTMVSAGVFGLISLLMLFLIPLRLFIGALADREMNVQALLGIMLIVGYASLGITHGMLEWEYENSFFLIFLAYVMIEINRAKSTATSL